MDVFTFEIGGLAELLSRDLLSDFGFGFGFEFGFGFGFGFGC
jgi:hypothetical protein